MTSWKEIASYLGVAIRSAQMWERQRGLPVRRLPGGRGRVSVTVGEIETWKHSVDPLPAPDAGHPSPEDSAAIPAPQWNRTVLLGVILLVAGTGIAAMVGLPRHRIPAGFRIEQNRLIVTDANNRELWWKPLDVPPPYSDLREDAWFGDLDGDGRTEMLFRLVSQSLGGKTDLICYSQDGRERWRFVPGKTVRTSKETFEPPYQIQRFVVSRLGRERAMRIVVSSKHFLYYPSQVVLLSPEGAIVREYWHSGGFSEVLVEDLEGNGNRNILLAGVNNQSKAATLVVLNPDTMSGASVEEKPEYQLQGFSRGTEGAALVPPELL